MFREIHVKTLRIETASYVRPIIPEEERLCLICNSGQIENETHFLLHCNAYSEERQYTLRNVENYDEFLELTDIEKMVYLLNTADIKGVKFFCFN